MELRGVRVHNLQGIDVTIPWGQWVAVSGVSGSGKSSLAFDTLYAEGQRRYLDSLSPAARQFLEQLPPPEVDHIDPLPPAVAVRQNARWLPGRSTVGSATEISHYLRLLFAKVGKIICPPCGQTVERHTPQQVLEVIHAIPSGGKFQIAFPLNPSESGPCSAAEWLERGFTRGIINHSTVNFQSDPLPESNQMESFLVVVDRLTAGQSPDERVLDSLEQAFSMGAGHCVILSEPHRSGSETFLLDGKPWQISRYSGQWTCETCQREFAEPEPSLFNPQSSAGACPNCQGQGSVSELRLDQLVPEPGLALEAGAIACFRDPLLSPLASEWLNKAQLAGMPLIIPFADLTAAQRDLLMDGDSHAEFPGLRKLFADLEQQSSKSLLSGFLKRWLLQVPCPDCHGQKLQWQARAVRVGNLNIAEVAGLSLTEFQDWLGTFPSLMSHAEQKLMAAVLAEMQSRIESLLDLGLDYLSLDRSVSTLSSGELQRVALTRIAGNPLVNSLYIFDEPSTGLHPADCERVIAILKRIKQADNTIVVVEHEDDFLIQADHLIDLGPGAGTEGGRVVFQGSPAKLREEPNSLTGRYVAGLETVHRPFKPQTLGQQRPPLVLRGLSDFPFQKVSLQIPLNGLCVLTGVSGSGKTVLLQGILYPALEHALGRPIPRSERARFDSLDGIGTIDEVVLLDQAPFAGSSRSNPATYLKIFDEIRRLFAETPDAKRQGLELKDFSFNSAAGGRCPACAGQGTVSVEMQFLADLPMVCPECQGTRYRREILLARYRGLNIGEVLNLTVAEAFPFFRTLPKIRKRLQVLKDVGLDYLPLGQPTALLSGGESQRLKLAGFLNESRRAHTLFLFDEPTSGLHPADVQTLLNCFDHLLSVGHSVIVAEHNLHLIRQADWVIDLGPGPDAAGGKILAEGPPEEIANTPESPTGRALKDWQSRKRIK